MAGVIDKFVFALFLDTKNFKQGADTAEKSVNGIKRTILQAYSAIGGINLFRTMLNDYSATAVELGRLSESTGENLRELEAWKLTVRDAGSDVGAFFGTLKMLNDEMANIKNYGTSASLATFQRLGISVYGANGQLKKGTDLLKDIGKRLVELDVRQAFNFGKALGLDEGTIIVLRRYGEGLEKIVKQNEKRALITKQDVANGMAYQKMLSELKQTFLSLEKAVVPEILKALKEIMPQLQSGLIAVIPLFKNLLSVVAPTAKFLAETAKYFEKVGEESYRSPYETDEDRKIGEETYGRTSGTDKDLQKRIDTPFSKTFLGRGLNLDYQLAGGIFSKDPIMSALGGSKLTNITIEALNITTQATDAQAVAKATVNAIANIANQTGR
jgi:hypothetical protein